jgi:uncharacterized protein YbcI
MTESGTERAISVALGSLHREHERRGTDRIRTAIHGDIVISTLEHSDCYTTVEHKLIAEGAFPTVRRTRAMSQDWMRSRLVEIVEQATSRKVRSFFSQVSYDPDIALEVFLLDPPTRPQPAPSAR